MRALGGVVTGLVIMLRTLKKEKITIHRLKTIKPMENAVTVRLVHTTCKYDKHDKCDDMVRLKDQNMDLLQSRRRLCKEFQVFPHRQAGPNDVMLRAYTQNFPRESHGEPDRPFKIKFGNLVLGPVHTNKNENYMFENKTIQPNVRIFRESSWSYILTCKELQLQII